MPSPWHARSEYTFQSDKSLKNQSNQNISIFLLYQSGLLRESGPAGYILYIKYVCVHVCVYVHIYIWREKDTERYFKELAHTIVGAGKSECTGQLSRPEIQVSQHCCLESEIYRAGQQSGDACTVSLLKSGGRIPSFLGHLRLFS